MTMMMDAAVVLIVAGDAPVSAVNLPRRPEPFEVISDKADLVAEQDERAIRLAAAKLREVTNISLIVATIPSLAAGLSRRALFDGHRRRCREYRGHGARREAAGTYDVIGCAHVRVTPRENRRLRCVGLPRPSRVARDRGAVTEIECGCRGLDGVGDEDGEKGEKGRG
jgi:hypothetical protein